MFGSCRDQALAWMRGGFPGLLVQASMLRLGCGLGFGLGIGFAWACRHGRQGAVNTSLPRQIAIGRAACRVSSVMGGLAWGFAGGWGLVAQLVRAHA